MLRLAAGSMTPVADDRALWLATHILPHEPALRHWLGRWRLWGLEVDDVVQETYAILAARASVADVRNPRAYCFQTARSIVLMHRRRGKVVSIQSVEPIEQMEIACDGPTPEQEVAEQDQYDRLARAMGELPETGRKALTLRIAEGLSQREIGQRLGMSENAAQKHIAKSVVYLMNMLGRGFDDAPTAGHRPSGHLIEDTPAPYGYARKQSGD